MKVSEWSGKETISVTDALVFLNHVAKLDPEFITRLCLNRTACNTAIRDHESIQAHCYDDASLENPKVGMVGFLNGLFGCDRNGFGAISVIMDKDIVVGFKLTDTAAFDNQD